MDVPNSAQGDYIHPIEPIRELPYYIRSNCFNYLRHVLNDVPPTATILANLGETGEIVVFYYASSGLYHYAVADSDTSHMISETNMYGATFSRRDVTGDKSIIGRYNIQ